MDRRSFKAVVFSAPKQVEVKNLPLRELQKDEVLVRAKVSGISVGTERSLLLNDGTFPGFNFPLIPGYQSVGIVEEIGPNVTGLRKGERVFIDQAKVPPGYDNPWGNCHAELLIPRTNPVKVPPSISDEEAALAQLAAIGWHGVKRAEVTSKDIVWVIGLGLVGQFAAQASKILGAKVVGLEIAPGRLKLAQKYSCDMVSNPQQDEAEKVLKPHGRATVVFDTVGSKETIQEAIKVANYQARILHLGLGPEIIYPTYIAHSKELTLIHTCHSSREDLLAVYDTINQDLIKIKPLISHEVKVDEVPEIYQKIITKDPNLLGAIIHWN